MPMFSSTGSMKTHATSAPCSAKSCVEPREVVVGDDVDGAGLDLERRHGRRRVLRAGLGDVGLHRHLERVVAAVVAALDLDDRLAAGERARRAQRVHRRLGPGVGEAQLVEGEAALEALGRVGRRRRRGHEQRAGLQRPADRGDDGGVEVADEHGAEAHRQVEQPAAVDVGEPGALAREVMATG